MEEEKDRPLEEAPYVMWRSWHTLEERENMIREAAYYRYLRRGRESGHEMDDWLAAEAELTHGRAYEAEWTMATEPEVQQSSVHGAAADDELKHMVRQHPQKSIPQVESVDPKDAPPKQ